MERENSADTGTFRVRYIFYFMAMLLALFAVLTYCPQDADVLAGGSDAPIVNWIGRLGVRFGWILFHLFGLASYLILLLFFLHVIRLWLPGKSSFVSFLSGTIMMTAGLVLLLALTPEPFATATELLGIGRSGEARLALSGGVIGQFFSAPPVPEFQLDDGCIRCLIGAVGTMICGWALLTGGGVIIYLSDWHELLCRFVTNSAIRPSFFRREEREEWIEEEPEDENSEEDVQKQEIAPVRSGHKSLFDFFRSPASEDREEAAAAASKKNSRLEQLLSQEEETEEDSEDPQKEILSAEEAPAPADAETAVEEEPAQKQQEEPEDVQEKIPVASPVQTAAAAAPAPSKPTGISAVTRETPEVSLRESAAGEKARSELFQYTLPPITMLAQGVNVVGENQDAINLAREKLQNTLDSFGIPGQVTGYISGPRVTRYEITLEPGVNVKKVEQISDNIAMNLSAPSVRVLAPIPGRPVVGVEVSNSKPEAVFMRSVMESDSWRSGKAEIPIALGKDVAGKAMILDLAKAPHLLVAGATGTGKSVCTNSLIISLLFRFRPDELKLIMVDPKIVEFEDYKRLPHLLTPIINESSKVPIALRWAANEMDRRYHVLARVGVKKLSEFNARPHSDEVLYDDEGCVIPDRLPVLIIIIDELADLMMTEAKKDVENSITRIAQKGRAAGIHIIVATQRPSTNVITGIIKANLPTRICFQVRSMVDSRVVLDTNGAEKLLGMGDMLCMSPSSMNIDRVQGAWVKDDDIKAIVKFVSDQAPQHFNDQVLLEPESGEEEDEEVDDDGDFDAEDQIEIAPLVKKYMRPGDDDTIRRALEVVILDRKASTSYLQRRLKIGYNRSAEIMDLFEERGIVGPPSGSGSKRNILIFDGMEINE